MTEHHNQSHLHKFILAYGSRRRNPLKSEGHSSKRWQEREAEISHLQTQTQSRESELEAYGWGFRLSKRTSSDTLPPAKSHHLNLPKEHHQLGTKNAKAWACGSHFSFDTSQRSSVKQSFDLSQQAAQWMQWVLTPPQRLVLFHGCILERISSAVMWASQVTLTEAKKVERANRKHFSLPTRITQQSTALSLGESEKTSPLSNIWWKVDA